jgi:ABC-type bacteriocin/lantibiotic exporter with double-glycine peptidase domain
VIRLVVVICFGQATSEEASKPGFLDVRCGAYCLYTALNSFDIPIPSLEAFERELGQASPRGYSMLELKSFAEQYGAYAVAVNTDLKQLPRIKQPFTCMALLRTGHYVIVYDLEPDAISIVDPPDAYKMRRGLFEQLFTGNTLLISQTELELPSRVRVWVWIASLAGVLLLGAVTIVMAKRIFQANPASFVIKR